MPVPTSTLSKPAGDSAGSSAGNNPAAVAGLSSPPSNINSNIWLAAGEGDLDSVRYLLDNQPDLTPTSPDDFSYTAVHAAASYAQLAVLDFLLCGSSSAADAVIHHLSLVDVLHGPPEVSTAAHLLSEIVYQNKDRLSAGIIVAGWDKRNGGATVCNVPLGGGLFQQPWAIGGWNRQQTVEFVTNALALAIRRDRSSGGTIRLADISEHGVESQFIPGDKLPELPAKLC
ncbi:unnamed protein product [Tilletia laevis]|nr:unnamed protein product [Tilletia laevis]